MTQNLPLKFSRRHICAAGIASAGVALSPAHSFAQDRVRVTSSAFHPGSALNLRGVRLGEHAMLRTAGTAVAEGGARAWTFREDTLVSWNMTPSRQVVEQRRGRIHLTPSRGGKKIEIATGPVEEVLDTAHLQAPIATSSVGQSLILVAGPLTPSDVWRIADDPVSAPLPDSHTEYRVFRTVGLSREFYWALRSPWLAALGESESDNALLWRGQGHLTAWRTGDGLASV